MQLFPTLLLLSLLRAPATATQAQIAARIGAEIQSAWVHTGTQELVDAGMLSARDQPEVEEAFCALITRRLTSHDPLLRNAKGLVEAMLTSPTPNLARYYRYAAYLDIMALLAGVPQRSLYWTAAWDCLAYRAARKAELRSL